MTPADLRRRLAAHGLTLTPGEHTTHGYTARWCVTGLEHGPAWFGELGDVAGWVEAWLPREETMQPYYEANGITIYCGDCRDVLPMLAERPTLVLTDPPYGANEKTDRVSRGNRPNTPKQSKKNLVHPPAVKHAPVAGDDRPFDPSHLLQYDKLILWGANYYADKLPASRSWLVWDKREGGTPDDNADCELAWTNLDIPARLYSHLWRGFIRRGEENMCRVLHPTQKPVALMLWCLSLAKLKPGDLVLDPYMGSGPVAAACKRLGLRYVGIELSESYCEIAVRHRLSQEVMPLFDGEAA